MYYDTHWGNGHMYAEQEQKVADWVKKFEGIGRKQWLVGKIDIYKLYILVTIFQTYYTWIELLNPLGLIKTVKHLLSITHLPELTRRDLWWSILTLDSNSTVLKTRWINHLI